MRNNKSVDARDKWKEIISELLPDFSEAVVNKPNPVPCPVHGGKDGFRFFDNFEENGSGVCNSCGIYSDGFKLIAWAKDCSHKDAHAMVRKFLAKPLSRPKIKVKKKTKLSKPRSNSKEVKKRFNEIARGCEDAPSENIQTYFEGRGLQVVVPPSVQYHPNLEYYGIQEEPVKFFPAIVFQFMKGSDWVGLHVTYLAPDGSAKAPVNNPKKTFNRYKNGSLTGAVIPLMDLDETGKLILAEGIETALACHQATVWPAWACGNISLMKKASLPDEVSEVYIAADMDHSGAGLSAAETLAQRLRSEGKKVYVLIPPGPIPEDEKSLDWLDVLNDQGSKTIESIFQNATPWEPPQAGTQTCLPQFIPSDDSGKPTPKKIVNFIREDYDQKLINNNGSFFEYQNGYWQEVHNDKLKNLISKLDGQHATGPRIDSTFKVLKAECWHEIEIKNIRLIGLQNGDFDPIKKRLVEHSPDHWIFNQLPIKWNPTAKYKLWKTTLQEIFDEDKDSKEKILLLQEWFGYCLIPETKFEKFLWIIGKGANGKSLILKILEEVIGKENVSNALLNRLDIGHVRASLFKKLINISSEMNVKATIADGYLKSIVSGDTIEADAKYRDPFSFQPFVRLVGATNELPPLLDFSHGFYRRAIILEFNRTFEESDQDKSRKKKLSEELPGIFVWAVEGLQRLLENDEFTIPPSSIKVLNEYIKDSDPVRRFAEEELEVYECGRLTPAKVYSRFIAWSMKNDCKDISKNLLGRRLTNLGYKKRKSNGVEFWKLKFKKNRTG